jgi:hypothetical protein
MNSKIIFCGTSHGSAVNHSAKKEYEVKERRIAFGIAGFLCWGMTFCSGMVFAMAGSPRQVIHVGEFGASPSVENNVPALQAAVEAAKKAGGPVEIRFEPDAVYRVGLPDGPNMQGKYALTIQGATNLVLNGQGATLLVTHPEIGAICTENCSGVKVRNFKIDYDPLPYAQGRIHAVNLDENWFELKVDDGFPEPDQPCFARAMSKWGLTLRDTADGGRQYGPAALFSKHWKKTGDRIWRFDTTDNGYDASLAKAGLQVGDRFIHMARNYAQAVAAKNCDGLLWDNITIYASPNLAFFPHITSRHTIRNCHVKVKDGRIFSTNADGIHMRGSRGHVLIEGCSFEGMADDAINVHSSAMSVQSQPNPNQVAVKKHTYTVRVGDRLEAVRSASAEISGQATVVAVEDQGGNWLVTLDRDFDRLVGSGTAEVNEHGDPVVSTLFYNLSEAANPVTVRNCSFNDHRGRGVLISARGATVENNTFNVREGWGVVMNYESSRWAEGPMAQEVVIRGNTFHAKAQSGQPAIVSVVYAHGGAAVEGAPFKNIRIEGNRFVGWKEPIRMQNAENVRVENNVVEE